MSPTRVVWLAVLVALTAVSRPASADEPAPRNVTVVGVGREQSTPDSAHLSFAVENTAPTAQAAAQGAAKAATQLLDTLRKQVGEDGKVETGGYQLSPVYRQDGARQVPPDRPYRPEIIGYTATNQIEVETRKIDTIGGLIDAAIAAGATRVGDVSFKLRDPGPARNRALKTAGADAAGQASAIAEALQVRLTRVLEASTEATSGPVVYRRTMAMAAETAATPIEPGDVTTEVRLRVTYGIE
jgi:uncharacterized protein YggE